MTYLQQFAGGFWPGVHKHALQGVCNPGLLAACIRLFVNCTQCVIMLRIMVSPPEVVGEQAHVKGLIFCRWLAFFGDSTARLHHV